MRIQNNIMAMNTHRQYNINQAGIAKSTEKLSSGYRINRAGDDAAGLAISEKMRAQIRGLTMASKNSQDAISLVQTAEGALQETHNILQRMRELAVQSGSDTNEKTIDRAALQQEFSQLQKEIDDIADKTVFNDQKLIDGTFASLIRLSSVEDATVGGVAGTFATAGGSVMLANNAKAGVYEFSVKQVTTGAVVGTQADDLQVGDIADTSGHVTAMAVNTLDTGLPFSSEMNGAWTLSYDEATQKVIATNENGKTYSAQLATQASGTTVTLNFGGLGTIDVTIDTASDLSSTADKDKLGNALTGQKFTLSGGVDPDLGTTKFYATMNGATDVEIQLGQEHVVFDNGITVNFGKALGAADLATGWAAAPAADGLTHADDAEFTVPTHAVGKVTVNARAGEGLIIQTGANQGDELRINVDRMNTVALGISKSNIGTRVGASQAITHVNNAINVVSTQRAALGALQNRLDHKIANLDTSAENLTAAEARIRDVDMAKEMTNFTKNNILFQASTAMLAQANAAPQGVLQLLG